MRVAICDDELASREHNLELVEAVAKERGIVCDVCCYETGEPLLEDVNEPARAPDIILLDIRLYGIDGIELGKNMRARGFDGIIVYVTVSDDRMPDAFDVQAFNYVVKTDEHGDERLRRVFMEAVARVRSRGRKRVLLNGISEHRSIPLEEIRYFEVLKHVCVVHYGKRDTFEFISSLGRIENSLMAYGFVRTQRSYLVNCAHVERFTFKKCVLDDGTEIPVGRQRYAALKEAMRRASME